MMKNPETDCMARQSEKEGKRFKRKCMAKFKKWQSRIACMLVLSFIFAFYAPSVKIIADEFTERFAG